MRSAPLLLSLLTALSLSGEQTLRPVITEVDPWPRIEDRIHKLWAGARAPGEQASRHEVLVSNRQAACAAENRFYFRTHAQWKRSQALTNIPPYSAAEFLKLGERSGLRVSHGQPGSGPRTTGDLFDILLNGTAYSIVHAGPWCFVPISSPRVELFVQVSNRSKLTKEMGLSYCQYISGLDRTLPFDITLRLDGRFGGPSSFPFWSPFGEYAGPEISGRIRCICVSSGCEVDFAP